MHRLALPLLFAACAACASTYAPEPAAELRVLAAAAAERAAAATPQSPTGTRPAEQQGAYPYYSGILTATLGYRRFHDSSFWEPLDDAFAAGLEYCFRGSESWLGLALGAAGSYVDRSQVIAGVSQDVDAWTAELYLGPKAYLEPEAVPLQFWAGAGASFLYADVKGSSGSTTLHDSDVTFGGYAQLGAAFRLNRRQSIGLEYRTLFATDIDVLGRPSDADYSQIALTFSVGF